MTPSALRSSVSKSPFRPFRLVLTDGRQIVCDNADHWCISEPGNVLVVAETRDGFTYLTADMIAEVVYLD